MLSQIKNHWACVLIGVGIGFLVLPRILHSAAGKVSEQPAS